MSLDDEITRSRTLVARWWHVVAERCPDPRLNGSTLQPVEGMNGYRSLDLDRRAHIDAFAVAGRTWTPLSTRFQSGQFADRRTVTFRDTEVRYLRDIHKSQCLAADLHVQMYGDADRLQYVVIAGLEPTARYFAEVHLSGFYWLRAPDGRPFIALTRGALSALDALVWAIDPNEPEQLTLLGGTS